MSVPEPTVVLVHGAFAESASWSGVVRRLQERDLAVVAVANPLRSVTTDADYLRDVLAGIKGPVVLAGHSYGGMVITEAASDLDAVVALVYVAAFAPAHGESALQLSGQFPGSTLGKTLSAYPLTGGADELVIEQGAFPGQFAADVPVHDATLMAATQRPVTRAALSEGLPTRTPAWGRVPSWFVYGDRDLNVPAALQAFMADRAGAKAARLVEGASHAISVSRPEMVAETIMAAVTATRG